MLEIKKKHIRNSGDSQTEKNNTLRQFTYRSLGHRMTYKSLTHNERQNKIEAGQNRKKKTDRWAL